MRRFSRPVRFSSTVAYWPASPISRRTVDASLTTSCPRTVARPVSGARIVDKMRTAVVLPAPLGPSRPSTAPPAGLDGRDPSRARTFSFRNSFTRFVGSTTAGVPTIRQTLPMGGCPTADVVVGPADDGR